LIVGIDSGISVGIAILDSNGKIVSVMSKRQQNRGEVIKHILKFGNPLVIASDVNPAPKFVEKIASSLGSKLFYPEFSMTRKEKENIVDDFEEEIKGSHQKDALAAGLKAFKSYHGIILKVKEAAGKNFEEVLRNVIINKKTENISDVVKKIAKKKTA
jgi:predicted RNase H-like nuclease (RuvC/YqgF family)